MNRAIVLSALSITLLGAAALPAQARKLRPPHLRSSTSSLHPYPPWPLSFDHLGASEHLPRRRQAERLHGLEVDRQLDRGRELHRQFVNLGAPQDAIDVGRRIRCDSKRGAPKDIMPPSAT